MLFIGLAILIAGLFALLIASDAGSLIGLTQGQFGQLVFLVLVLVVIAAGGFGRRVRAGQMLSGALMWAAIFAVAIGAYAFRDEFQYVGGRLLGELAPGNAEILEGGAVSVRRSFGGSFRVDGTVNGANVRFIFDTGASAVVLSAADAKRAGVDLAQLRYSVPVQTANGTGRAAPVTIGEITIGGIVRRGIHGFVAEPGSLDTSLLGTTFLETLSSYRVANDRLELMG
ncbi:MAG TPA: TIGR02281 family clan AA aspartic protease [Devosiaceae bacterium]|nr:TIGR02281 family clan AA aspartic protease [Devosiaceae bacterium]